ncbi:stress response translation initiation inhibitor YciH [Halobacteriaceae archaeon GCM10025711]
MAENDDPTAGLPDEFDRLDDLARAEQELTIRTETRRYGKTVTIVEGFDPSFSDVTDLASTLKRALGTGGSVVEGRVELQGDHVERVQKLLQEQGYRVA